MLPSVNDFAVALAGRARELDKRRRTVVTTRSVSDCLRLTP